MKVLKDQAAIQAALDDLVAAQSETQRLLTMGQELDTLNEANPNVPYSTLQEFGSSTDNLMQQVNNAIEDINANVEELSSAITSGIEPAIEVGTSLATIQTAITSIGLPMTIAAGAATGIFVVMGGLLALFTGGSSEDPVATDPDCSQDPETKAVVILTKEGTSFSEFKALVQGFPEDKDAKQFTDDWQPNFIYAGTIDLCSALELNINPIVDSWMVDVEMDLKDFLDSESAGSDSTNPPTELSSRAFPSERVNTTAEENLQLPKRGIPTSDSTFLEQAGSPAHLQWLAAPMNYNWLRGSYYNFQDLIFKRVAQSAREQPIIYLIDTGFEYTHPDYADRLIARISLDENTYSATFIDHGTCMASLAGGSFSGMAKEARIATADLETVEGSYTRISTTFNLLRQVYFHARNNNGFGNSVVSMSMANNLDEVFFGKDAVWEAAGVMPAEHGSKNCFDTMLNWFWAKGMITTTSAGNQENSATATQQEKDLAWGFPRSLGGANSPLIVVGNAKTDTQRYPTSSYRDSSNDGILSIYSYGEWLECATLNGQWKTGSIGTSGANAIIAGLLAYYLSQPDLKAQFQADGLQNVGWNAKQYLLNQATQLKGTFEDGIPRAASGDLVPCINGYPGWPPHVPLRYVSQDRTLRTEAITWGLSLVMEDLPECWDFDLNYVPTK
ncbi:peptidase S8/S53 domain-containing protein [Aspergillus crustosus]